MPSRSSGAFVAAALVLAPAVARAADNREISTAQSLGGDQVFNELTITASGKLSVSKRSATNPNGGWLRVKANKISIFGGGIIEANGAGYQGVSGADGEPAGAGGGKYNGAVRGPGGGGGFFGAGASGQEEAVAGACTGLFGSEGGIAFFDGMTPSLGAAGGSSHGATLNATGAAGGGGIILSAGIIVLEGLITANGDASIATGGAAAGGGAGGTIQLITAQLMGGGKVEVRGGNGAHGTGSTNPSSMFPPNNGGGGSGGVVIVMRPMGSQLPFTQQAAVDGGTTGDCATGSGPNGTVVKLDLDPCLDLDGDTYISAACAGGDDCDDTDKDIRPGVYEACDGKDNNCNGKSDEENTVELPDAGPPPVLCSPGLACKDGRCQSTEPDAGAGGGGSSGGNGGEPAAKPDHIEFGGGCALPGRSGAAEGAAGAALLGLGAMALALSRRRSRGKR